MELMEQFWKSCLNHLRTDLNLSAEEFDRCLPFLSVDRFDEEGGVLYMSADGIFRFNWAQLYFVKPIQVYASSYFRQDVRVNLVLKGQEEQQDLQSFDSQTLDVDSMDLDQVKEEALEGIQKSQLIVSKSKAIDLARLIPDFTLDNFVRGEANRFAVAAADQVIQSPGNRNQNNPFFIYGKTGLGKTHLMHAIGFELIEQGRVRNVRAVEAQVFCEEYMRAARNKTIEQFKSYYYDLDVLLVDDVQFFTEKTRTEEVFLYLFESLIRNGKQVVLTCDRHPNKLDTLKESLKSRFLSGLIVEVKPPSLEMRISILQKKAQQKALNLNINLPYESARYIAKHLKTNVRELEGALSKVISMARFENVKELDVDFCKMALEDLFSSRSVVLSIEDIQKEVADVFGITPKDLVSKSRTKNLIIPRHVAMLLSKELTSYSMVDIGKAFNRDHSTVLSGLKNIDQKRKLDQELDRKINILEKRLKG